MRSLINYVCVYKNTNIYMSKVFRLVVWTASINSSIVVASEPEHVQRKFLKGSKWENRGINIIRKHLKT